ncbi:MAG: hypothetical protein WD847_12640 [Pirellulales bacterium]
MPIEITSHGERRRSTGGPKNSGVDVDSGLRRTTIWCERGKASNDKIVTNVFKIVDGHEVKVMEIVSLRK